MATYAKVYIRDKTAKPIAKPTFVGRGRARKPRSSRAKAPLAGNRRGMGRGSELTVGLLVLTLGACSPYHAPEARVPSDVANAEWLPYPEVAMRVFDPLENREDPDPLLRWRLPVVRIAAPAARQAMLIQAIAEWQSPGLPRLKSVLLGSPAEIVVQENVTPEPHDADELGYAQPDVGDPPPWGPSWTHASVVIRIHRGVSEQDYPAVLTHEVGHALGFWRHAANPGLLMAAELPEAPTHVSLLERETLRALYAERAPKGWAEKGPSLWDYLRKGLGSIRDR